MLTRQMTRKLRTMFNTISRTDSSSVIPAAFPISARLRVTYIAVSLRIVQRGAWSSACRAKPKLHSFYRQELATIKERRRGAMRTDSKRFQRSTISRMPHMAYSSGSAIGSGVHTWVRVSSRHGTLIKPGCSRDNCRLLRLSPPKRMSRTSVSFLRASN